jgi:hypothetical protein
MPLNDDLSCRICAKAFSADADFHVAEIHASPLLPFIQTLTVRHKEYPQETIALASCSDCFKKYVQPAAELNQIPDYRRRIAVTVFAANLPAMLLPIFVLWPLYKSGAAWWITALVSALIIYPALLVGNWLRLSLNRHLFGERIQPLAEKLGMSGQFEITRVKAAKINEVLQATTSGKIS